MCTSIPRAATARDNVDKAFAGSSANPQNEPVGNPLQDPLARWSANLSKEFAANPRAAGHGKQKEGRVGDAWEGRGARAVKQCATAAPPPVGEASEIDVCS